MAKDTKAGNKPDHIRFQLKTFSSDEIDAMLENGSNFRELKPGAREAYLDSMRNGWWDFANGETLSLTEDGKLLNGQHRLSAAAIFQRETGQKCWFWCAIGVDPKASFTMDNTKARRFNDYLRNEGVADSSIVGAIVQAEAAAALERKLTGESPKSLAFVLNRSGSVKRKASHKGQWYVPQPSMGMLLDIWKRNRGVIQEWATIGRLYHNQRLSRPAQMASMGYQLAKKKEVEAKLFFDYLTTGAGLKDGDPILMLRDRLLKDRLGKTTKMSGLQILAITIKAWVAWNTGRELQLLRWAPSGPMAEEFPSHEFED